jgi:hypothetical protein
VHGNSHEGTVLSYVLLFSYPIFTNVRHLDVLLLKNNLCSFHTTLLDLLIFGFCMFRFTCARSRCGHVSMDCA